LTNNKAYAIILNVMNSEQKPAPWNDTPALKAAHLRKPYEIRKPTFLDRLINRLPENLVKKAAVVALLGATAVGIGHVVGEQATKSVENATIVATPEQAAAMQRAADATGIGLPDTEADNSEGPFRARAFEDYTVKPGDSPWKVAEDARKRGDFGNDVDIRIVVDEIDHQANADGNGMQPGEHIHIPISK
jgi:hypothetical protein